MSKNYTFDRAQIEGNLESAIEHFLPDKNGWTNFHHFCYWELFWCYGILGDFENAEKYINLLLQESLWSPAIYSWLMATVLVIKSLTICNLPQKWNRIIRF